MAGKIVPDPDKLALKKALSVYDYAEPRDVPLIPAEEAFEKYIRILWELNVDAGQQGVSGAMETCDFIIHRAAYLYVMADWNDIPNYAAWCDPARFIAEARRGNKGKVVLYKRLIGMLSEVYPQLAYGWNKEILFNKVTWGAELARYDKPWVQLFPSYCNEMKVNSNLGKMYARRTPTGIAANRVAVKTASAGQAVGSLCNSPLPAASAELECKAVFSFRRQELEVRIKFLKIL